VPRTVNTALTVAALGDRDLRRDATPDRYISLRSATRARGRRSGSPDLRRLSRYPYMSDVIVIPWSRYGKKRLYVKTADGTEIGHVDLVHRCRRGDG
jgi:hypothetical protein